jgi:carbon monoxide dehydrogenase subunit G
MVEVSESVVVHAPRESVFEFVDRPDNQVAVTPALTGVADVQSKPDGGKRLLYGYRVFGIVFTGALETTTYDPPERIVFEMTGDIEGKIRWTIESLPDDRTRFTYAADYDLSWLPLYSFLLPLLRWYNRRELRQAVENIREAVESGAAAETGTEISTEADRSRIGERAAQADADS